MAGDDLGAVGALVDPALASRLPLEVLHGVRHVDLLAVEPGVGDRLVEDPARGSDERLASLVLLVARLLADHHQPRGGGTGAEDGLGGALPQTAAAAVLGVDRQLHKAVVCVAHRDDLPAVKGGNPGPAIGHRMVLVADHG